MIIFIDEKSGESYSAPSSIRDAERNFDIKHTFYFNDNQSTGLFYQKRLFFITDLDTVKVSIPRNDIFFLYDKPESQNSITGTSIELESIKKYDIDYIGESISEEEGVYMYCINIGCKSDTVGEFTEELIFSEEDDTIISKYYISADFWTQREELEILLNNQGINIPKDIVRSFYDTNIHEMSIDWITLNRKYKELLLNIMDILYKKGSYESLISSLNWFEYGDMIKLYEFWSTPKISTLYKHEITTMYTDALRELISKYRKTTFVAIAFSINKIKDGQWIEDENHERLLPVTEDILQKWSLEDIMLKMTLLGNYFSTYFMPIHLDLLFSSVEKIVLDVLKNKSYISNIGVCTNCNDMGGDVLRLYPIQKKIIYGDVYINKANKIELLSDIQLPDSEEDYGKGAENLYIGQGVLIDIKVCISNIFRLKTHNYTKIATYVDDVYREYPIVLETVEDPDSGKLKYPHTNVKIFISSSGKKNIGINIISDCGCILSKSITVEIEDKQKTDFITKKLTRLTLSEAHTMCQHNALSFPQDPLPSKIDRNRLNIPDYCFHNISACFIDTDSDIFYICKNWTPDSKREEYIEENINNIDNIREELYEDGWIIYTKNVDTGVDGERSGKVIYIIQVEPVEPERNMYTIRPTNVPDDNRNIYDFETPDEKGRRSIKYFNERRFIPSLWKEQEDVDFISTPEDTVYKCIPFSKLHCDEGNIVWKIKNISTGEEGIIKNLQEPIFWCNNCISSQTSKVGTYSISLQVDNNITTHNHVFRVVNNA